MIGARLWKRRRVQPVTTRAVVFNDSSDSHDDLLFDAGAIESLAPSAPRPLVHRSSVDLSRLVDHSLDQLRRQLELVPYPTRPRGLVGSKVQRRLGLVARPSRVRVWSPSFAEFNRLRLDPRTATCVRRGVRREVLFARRVAGSRGLRSYRRTVSSQWSC